MLKSFVPRKQQKEYAFTVSLKTNLSMTMQGGYQSFFFFFKKKGKEKKLTAAEKKTAYYFGYQNDRTK